MAWPRLQDFGGEDRRAGVNAVLFHGRVEVGDSVASSNPLSRGGGPSRKRHTRCSQTDVGGAVLLLGPRLGELGERTAARGSTPYLFTGAARWGILLLGSNPLSRGGGPSRNRHTRCSQTDMGGAVLLLGPRLPKVGGERTGVQEAMPCLSMGGARWGILLLGSPGPPVSDSVTRFGPNRALYLVMSGREAVRLRGESKCFVVVGTCGF